MKVCRSGGCPSPRDGSSRWRYARLLLRVDCIAGLETHRRPSWQRETHHPWPLNFGFALAERPKITVARVSAPAESTVLAVRLFERTIMATSWFMLRADRCFIAFVALRGRSDRRRNVGRPIECAPTRLTRVTGPCRRDDWGLRSGVDACAWREGLGPGRCRASADGA